MYTVVADVFGKSVGERPLLVAAVATQRAISWQSERASVLRASRETSRYRS